MKNVFTIAGAGCSAGLKKNCACGHGFTMAEILLSLTIIGVVAAITLPSLTGNINERTWNTQRKALYARFSQAIALMPSLNGYGTLTEESSSGADDGVDTAAETFITAGLSKVLKINNICDSEHLEDCGIPNKITPYSGDIISPFPKTFSELNPQITSVSGTNAITGDPYSYSQMNTKVAAFETANGESVALFYNKACLPDLKSPDHWNATQQRICANFIYDLNGQKGPNTMGKDIGFISVFYPTDSIVVAPYPYLHDAPSSTQVEAIKACTAQDSEYRLPNQEEASSLFVNRLLLGNYQTGWYWTSGINTTWNTSSVTGVVQSLATGGRFFLDRNSSIHVRCVKKKK